MTNKTNWLSRRMWGLSALCWGSITCIQWLAVLPGSREGGYPGAWLTWTAMCILPLMLATPPLFHFCQRIVLRDQPKGRPWPRLAAIVIGASALHALAPMVVAGSLIPLQVYVSYLFTFLFQYVAVAAVGIAVNQRQLAEVRQRELLDAQLRALRSQLQPHFLFNTLHAISVTGRTDSSAATRMLTLLGDLLRQTLRERNGEFVTLAEEQELLQPYLELQKLRFPDRLRIEIDFPEDVLGCAVPDLLLQPLVENALKHGLEQRPEGGTVRIAARRWGDRLEIQVRDDGAGLAEVAGGVQLGVGLGTTKARLQALFGAAATVKLAPAPGGGAVATVTLPWREVARAA